MHLPNTNKLYFQMEHSHNPPLLSPASPDRKEDQLDRRTKDHFTLKECLVPPFRDFNRKMIWMDSLRRIAEHTLFDHSSKIPSVIYTNYSDNPDGASSMDFNQLPYKGPTKSNSNKHSYREKTKSGSSESDTTPSKKVRKALDNFETQTFPLTPDFSDLRDQEVEGYPLNLSLPPATRNLTITEDLRGLDLSISKATSSDMTLIEVVSSDSDTPVKLKTEPILETLWRSPGIKQPSDNSTQTAKQSEESSNITECPPASKPHHKWDKDKLAKLRETISEELARIRLDAEKKLEADAKLAENDQTESRKRKLQISKIVWDPTVDGVERTPKKEDIDYRKLLIRPPTQAPEERRERKILRKCQLCNKSTANMKNHLAFCHLKEDWWGVLADQTCWKCKNYHPCWRIAQCDGAYNPLLHKSALICRHREFIDHTMEDFEIVSPQELVEIVRNMRLCDSSISGFSEREEYFLKEIDDHLYDLPVKHKHSSMMPTRPSELIHWKTITQILAYTRERGAISSSIKPRKLVPLIDTRCDLVREYELLNYSGLLFFYPPLTAMIGKVRIKSVVAEIFDPRQLQSPAFESLRRDPMVKLSIGIRPDLIQLVDQKYMETCHRLTTGVQLVAIGPIGIDIHRTHVCLDRQVTVFREFVRMANLSGRPLRIYYTQNHDISFDIAEKGLPRGHPVHLVNFSGGNAEARAFKQAFSNGYFGISTLACNPPPYYSEFVRSLLIDRMVLESNSPHSSLENHQETHPTDVAEILAAVAFIKDINIDTVAKYFRRNTCALYRY